MIALYIFVSSLFRRIRNGLREPEFRGLFYGTLLIVGFGGFFYHRVEGWSLLDAYYFTIITLTTIGYGDFSPQTNLGKIFTIFYVLIGLGIISSFILLLARQPDRKRPFLSPPPHQPKEEEQP